MGSGCEFSTKPRGSADCDLCRQGIPMVVHGLHSFSDGSFLPCGSKVDNFIEEPLVKPKENMTISVPPGHESLAKVLEMALNEAAAGKGKERHACELPFEQQQSAQITKRQGVGYPLGQAEKKLGEAPRLDGPHRVKEIIGAINYAALGVIHELKLVST